MVVQIPPCQNQRNKISVDFNMIGAHVGFMPCEQGNQLEGGADERQSQTGKNGESNHPPVFLVHDLPKQRSRQIKQQHKMQVPQVGIAALEAEKIVHKAGVIGKHLRIEQAVDNQPEKINQEHPAQSGAIKLHGCAFFLLV